MCLVATCLFRYGDALAAEEDDRAKAADDTQREQCRPLLAASDRLAVVLWMSVGRVISLLPAGFLALGLYGKTKIDVVDDDGVLGEPLSPPASLPR